MRVSVKTRGMCYRRRKGAFEGLVGLPQSCIEGLKFNFLLSQGVQDVLCVRNAEKG